MQLLFLAMFLGACSDETPSGPKPSPGGSVSAAPGPVLTANPPTLVPPTPTYTALPTTPTPQPTPTPSVVTGGKATGAVLNDGLTLHPYKRNNATGQSFVRLVWAAGLTRLDPALLKPIPGAAESWTISDTTVTFVLREDLKWSDGLPLTSADYLWTFQQARKSENGWPLLTQAVFDPTQVGSNGIESYDAPDPRTLKIKLHTFSADLVERADVIEPLPRHIWQSLDWNDPAKNPQINAPVVVSGPWKFKEWKRGQSLSLERNSTPAVYPAPHLDALNFSILPDSQTAQQRLKSGEVDFFSPAPGEWSSFVALPGLQSYTWGPARAKWYYAGFNFRRPDLGDKTLRQALAWAVDRRMMLEKSGFGLGRNFNSSVTPWHPAFQPFTARYDLNIDKARQLLKAGGYTVKDGKLTNKAGKVVGPLRIVYTSPSPLYDSLAATLKANFAALDLQVELRNYDFESFKRLLATPGGEFDLFLSGWTTDYAPANFGDVWRGGSELNSGGYENPRLLEAYAKALTDPEEARRKESLDLVQNIEAEELPYLFLYAEEAGMVVNKRLAGFAPGLLGPERNLYTDWFATK